MSRVSLKVNGQNIEVVACYIPTFPRRARGIAGADFDKPSKTWTWPLSELAKVETLLEDVYGEFTGYSGNRVDVLVNLELFGTRRRGFFGLGRQIANRGRDGKFYLGPDVLHMSGSLPAEINTETPDMIGYNTAILKVQGVPEDLAKREVAQHPNKAMIVCQQGAEDATETATMLKHGFTPGEPLPGSKAELSAYKNALLQRLAEVQRAMNKIP